MRSIYLLLFSVLGTFTYAQSDLLKNRIQEKIEFHKRRNLDSLRYYVDLSLNESSEKNFSVYLDLVEGYLNFNEFEKSKSLLDSLSIDQTAEKFNYARSLIYNGLTLRGVSENQKALETFYNALEFVETHELTDLEAEIYFGIASMLSRNNDLANCTKYYRLAAQKAKQYDNIDLLVKSNIQLCRVFNGWVTVLLDSSVYYGKEAIRISQEADYELGYAHSLSVAAAPIIRNGEVEEGLQMSKDALTYADTYNFSSLERYYLTLNQGFAFEQLKQFDSAKFYMGKAAELRPESIDHLRLKYLIFKSQNNYKDAIAAYEEYHSKQVLHIRRRNESNLSLAQARYETDLKEKEVASLSQQASIQALEIQQKNQALIIGVVVFLFVIAAIFFIYKQRETKKQQSQTELEQRFLRSQLNPHFISNAMVAVQSFMLKNDSESAALYLTKFSKLMREILENSRKEFIPVEEEINMLKNYLDIHKLRLGTFDYSIELSENIDPETDTIPPMFIQPFLENAIEHGIANEKNGKVDLKFSKEGNYISILVNDNGPGISMSHKKGHNSLSSTIIQERIDIFNKSLKKKIKLVIGNMTNENGEVNGTKVELKVPFSYI